MGNNKSLFDKFQYGMDKVLGPLTKSIGTNPYVKAITEGFMATMMLTLGAALFALLANFPYAPITNFLTNLGLISHMNALVETTSTLLGLFASFSIAYSFAKNDGKNPLHAGLLSVATFLIMMPHVVTGQTEVVSGLSLRLLGTDGVLVALVNSLVVAKLFCVLIDKGFSIKMPASVPVMVSESFKPIVSAIIIFICAFIVRVGFAATGYESFFGFITSIFAKPMEMVGGNPWSVIFVYCFANLVWWFGIHPSPILSLFYAAIMPIAIANVTAVMSGQPMPYLSFAVVAMCVYVGGSANSTGLIIALFSAKSERYKAIRKVGVIPALVNITEPLSFAMPLMLNPIYFFPMVFTSLASGILGVIAVSTGFITNVNVAIQLPWTTPTVISTFLQGGLKFLLLNIACILIHAVIYYPFVKLADRKICKEEAEAK